MQRATADRANRLSGFAVAALAVFLVPLPDRATADDILPVAKQPPNEYTPDPRKLLEAEPPWPFAALRRDGAWLHAGQSRFLISRATGLPAAIQASGRAISARSSQWRIDGKLPDTQVEEIALSSGRALWRTESEAGPYRLVTELELSFDGFLRVRATVSGPDNAGTPNLRYVQPLTLEASEYLSRLEFGAEPLWVSAADDLYKEYAVPGRHRALAVTDGCSDLPFAFQYTLSGTSAGLLFTTESAQAWSPERRDRAFRICRDRNGAQLEIQWLTRATRFLLPATIEFAIQPLPVRPLPTPDRMSEFNPAQFADARSLYRRGLHRPGSVTDTLAFDPARHNRRTSALDAAVADGLRTLVVHQGWTEIQGYPGTRDPRRLRALRRIVEDAHARELKVLLYLGREVPENAPEWAQIEQIAKMPERPGRRRGTIAALRPGGSEEPWASMLVHRLRSLKDTVGIDGVFLDMLAAPEPSSNARAGQGFVDPSMPEERRPTLAVNANRDLLRRIYTVFHTHGDEPGGIVACHAGGPHRPSHSFCDYVLVGEEELSLARRDPAAARHNLTRHREFGAIYSPVMRGVPIVWLSKASKGWLVAGCQFVGGVALQYSSARAVAALH